MFVLQELSQKLVPHTSQSLCLRQKGKVSFQASLAHSVHRNLSFCGIMQLGVLLFHLPLKVSAWHFVSALKCQETNSLCRQSLIEQLLV